MIKLPRRITQKIYSGEHGGPVKTETKFVDSVVYLSPIKSEDISYIYEHNHVSDGFPTTYVEFANNNRPQLRIEGVDMEEFYNHVVVK